MSRKDSIREELENSETPTDRRVNQAKGEIDVSGMDVDDLNKLRDEDITNINENELDELDAHVGVMHRSGEEGSNILPVEKLNQELQDEEDADDDDR